MKKLNQKISKVLISTFVIIITLQACMDSFLDVKPDKSLVVPETIDDLESLLNNSLVMNFPNSGYLPIILSDDYVMTEQRWNSTSELPGKYGYIWSEEIYQEDITIFDWKLPYQQVFYSNLVLDKLKSLKTENSVKEKLVKGAAYFYRALAYFNISQLYSTPYSENSKNSDLGIPIRLEADVLLKSYKSTINETYNQIINDFHSALILLPQISLLKSKPSKNVVYGMLSRIHLQMHEYDKALIYADSALAINSSLLDFKTVDKDNNYPFNIVNEEIIYSSTLMLSALVMPPNQLVAPDLLALYKDDDLRKQTFFVKNTNGQYSFKGSYDGSQTLFNGLTNAEIMLIRSECLVRLGFTAQAIQQLEVLYKKRNISEFSTPDNVDLLQYILDERRRELAFRGIRWWDMRRLKNDNRYAIPVKRIISDQIYWLRPDASNYFVPIPNIVLQLSGM